MKEEPRQLTAAVKTIITLGSGGAFLGCCFLAVGAFGVGLVVDDLMHAGGNPWQKFAIAFFGVVGLALILQDRKRASKNLHILKYGSMARGRFESKKKKTEHHRGGDGGGSISEYYLYTYRFDSEGRPDRYAQARSLWSKTAPQEATVIYANDKAQDKALTSASRYQATRSDALLLDLLLGGMRLDGSTVKGNWFLALLILMLPLSVVAAAVAGFSP